MGSSQTLPPPQGPEYTPCGCGHIEPEHQPDAGPCLVCGCTSYGPALSPLPAPRADIPTDEDFLVALEEALEKNLLPAPGFTVLERTRDAVAAALGPLVTQLRRARDLAIAHDRQPYPTAWAYEQACKALRTHRDRADELEQEVRRLRLMVDEYGAGASALTDKLKRAREMHRETCPLARGGVSSPAFRCGMCEVLDAPAALPAPVDRAAVYRELADRQTQLAIADDLARRRDVAAARRQFVKELRRLAAGERDEQQAQQDSERRVYAWAQTIDTVDGGRTIHIPGVHHSGSGPEETAIVVSREDVPGLAAMLTEEQQAETQAHPPYDSWLVEWCAEGGDWAVAYPTHDHSKALDRLARGRRDTPEWQWRLVRETTSYTVEIPPAVEAEPGKEA